MASLKRILYSYFNDKVHYQDIVNDPAFDIGKVDDGFADRMEWRGVNNIPRIVSSYNKAKSLQAKMPSAYQVGNEWLPIYDKYMGEVMHFLMTEDIGNLARIYNNFMRDQCSAGLHGISLSMNEDFFAGKIKKSNKKLYMRDTVHRMRLWKQYFGNKYVLSDLDSPNIGNPYGIILGGHFIQPGSFYNHYYAEQIGNLLRGCESTRKVVCEVGAGYGAMAYYLCRNVRNLTYVAIDLPENMALTAYYLMAAFPDKKILLHGEAEIDKRAYEKYDIILLPNCDFEKLPTEFCDVIFNSYSLAEMSKETIELYVNHIMRVCRGYFLHVNHNKNAEVIADDFRIDGSTYSLLYKTPARWNYGRNIHMDEFEYLYQKIKKM